MADPRAPRLVAFWTAGLATLMSAWLFLLHLRMVASPAPQEMREGASLWITRLLLEGRNPYAIEELPASTDVYGIFYYLVVQPFARLVGNGYPVHRAISALSILGACVLLYRLLRRRGTDRVLAAVGTLLFYASCLYFVAPVARPDGLGVFLSLLSITWLFDPEVTPARFAVGLLVALLALLTKVYLAYPPFVMAAYVFLYVSRPRGLAYAFASLAAGSAVLLAATRVYPAYISVAIMANGQDTAYDGWHMLSQTADWMVFSLPLTAAVVVALLHYARTPRPMAPSVPRLGAFGFAGGANALVFALLLGGHPGAHMTYLFQLVTPLLIVAVFPIVGRHQWTRAVVIACLPISLGLNAHYFPLSFGRFAAAEGEFARVTAAMASHADVLGSTEVAGALALAGRPVFDTGQSEYFWHGITETSAPGLVPAAALTSRWDGFVADIALGITTQRFDLVVRSRRHGLLPSDLIEQHYQRARTVDLDFAWAGQRWPVDLWEPRRPR